MTLHQPLHRPDPTACGCDYAPDLVPVDQAIARGLAIASRLQGTEILPLGSVNGRVLAQDIASPVPLPLFDNAAMDGYAVRLADLTGAGPWCLPVTGRVCAGDAPCALPKDAAVRILTGAPVPVGADAVIAQEHVVRSGNMISISTIPREGQHIRRCGEDLAVGAHLLSAGRVIGSREAAALAGTGVGNVPVMRRLRVAILCSGSELVDPGTPLAPGQVWDANHAMLAAALNQPWITVLVFPTSADDPDDLCRALSLAAAQADILITTGGVSVGDEDHMARVIDRLGGKREVTGLAMKPGKPLSIGTLRRALWLGLPGNPVAAFVTWHVLGQLLAGYMVGATTTGPGKTLAALTLPIRHKPGRCEYRLAQFVAHDARGVMQVACMEDVGSHRIAQLAQADALVIIPSEIEDMGRGDLVEVMPL